VLSGQCSMAGSGGVERMVEMARIKEKMIHHRGAEGTEKIGNRQGAEGDGEDYTRFAISRL